MFSKKDANYPAHSYRPECFYDNYDHPVIEKMARKKDKSTQNYSIYVNKNVKIDHKQPSTRARPNIDVKIRDSVIEQSDGPLNNYINKRIESTISDQTLIYKQFKHSFMRTQQLQMKIMADIINERYTDKCEQLVDNLRHDSLDNDTYLFD